MKDAIVALIRRRFADRYASIVTDGNESMACILWAATVVEVLGWHGIKAAVIGGSASFLFRTDANDDGVSSTHFSYMFNRDAATLDRLSRGVLPEMHAWVETTDEVIDVTTGFQQTQMSRLLGLTWDDELVPADYLWCKKTELTDKRFVYRADNVATAIARKVIRDRDSATVTSKIA